jgi:hypothetical protein
MRHAESGGYYDLIMSAESKSDQLEAFRRIKTDVKRFFAATKIQASARGKMARNPQKGADLQETFLKYARYGKGTSTVITEMDGKRFQKFCKENKLLHRRKFNNNAADLLFTSVKNKGTKVITFRQFKDQALPKVAAKLGITMDELLARVSGPQSSGTKAQYNKFYDDKSTWGEGVAANGGPSTIDGGITLSNLADRSASDIRGRKL